MNYPSTFDNMELTAIFASVEVYNVIKLDRIYAVVEPAWLPRFGLAFEAHRIKKWGGRGYASEVRDCDDYAFTAFEFARECHRGTRTDAAGLAFGVVLYQRTNGGHAINVAIARHGAEPTVIWWEPQTRQEVALTADERRTAWVLI